MLKKLQIKLIFAKLKQKIYLGNPMLSEFSYGHILLASFRWESFNFYLTYCKIRTKHVFKCLTFTDF